MAPFVSENRFVTAKEFLLALTPWTSSIDLKGYVFRGHSNSNFQLIPKSIRQGEKDDLWKVAGLQQPIFDQSEWEYWQSNAEYVILREFYRIADKRGLYVPHVELVRQRLNLDFDTYGMLNRSGSIWLPDDLLELAALAQHYGLPTRLLDWTHDPLVSCYFAAQSESYGDFIEVWALDAEEMSEMSITTSRTPMRLVNPPYAGNPNLAAQSGIFTSWSVRTDLTLEEDRFHAKIVDRTPLDQLLRIHMENVGWESPRSPFLRFQLASQEAPEVLSMLRNANYGASRMFPGYDGVSREVVLRAK